MSILRLCGIVRSFLLLILVSLPAPAQFVRGSLVGTISDDSGAVIPGAEIVLHNVNTNETKTFTTDAGGSYNFAALLPGLYRIEVKKTGFKTQTVSEVRLEVNQTARVDVRLPVGDVGERIERTAPVAIPCIGRASKTRRQVPP